MELNDKKLEAVSVRNLDSSPASDDGSILYKQTRTRRIFTAPQMFAFAVVYLGTWYYVAGNIYFALQNGGPAGWFFSYLVVVPGVLCQAASFAEMASIQPIAGAQYYWTYHLAPRNLKLFLTWIQGWTTWFGYVAFLASCLNGHALYIEGVVSLNKDTYEAGTYKTTLIILGYLAVITLANLFAFRAVPYLEFVAGVVNFVLFMVLLVMLWIMAPRNSADIFLVKSVSSGWDDNYFVSFNIGTLSNIYLFLAFESMIHMGEETKDPRRTVPQALFWGIVVNMILGFIMFFTFGICMPSVDELLSSVSPLVTALVYGTGSIQAATGIMICFLLLGFAGNIGLLASVSRLSWAWARDGGLPVYFGFVNGRTRVPLRAVVGTSTLTGLLALLNLSSESYVAFAAITSLTAMALYVSYAIVLACIIYARFATPGGIVLGEWNLGRAGLFLNVFGLVYTVYEIIWLPFPNVLPVTANNMNYSGPIYLAVIIGAVGYWFLWAQRKWQGPNNKIVEIVLRNDDASS